ncbi:MAG: extensin family protein [Sandaracinaceae bacterium]|nr:extensin family protein [Sandaracinaceae bacterium]
MRRLLLLMSLLPLSIAGCRSVDLSPSDRAPSGGVRVVRPMSADVDAGGGGGVDATVTPMPRVTITAPMDGATFPQDALVGGEWAASVTFTVDAADVARVELVSGGVSLGDVMDGSLTYAFYAAATHTVDAIGYDDAGVELARDSVTITVTAPADTGCHATLDALGLDWAVAGASPGIADPVRVQPIINGVAFRYVSNTEPTAMLMDCELAIRLYRLTELVIPYGIDEVIHIGIYNYRCIGGGDPDSGTCTPSQHAYARAIDLHAFGLAGSDETYSTETDFVITTRSDPCPIPFSNDKDRVLKELACSMWSERVFEIVLTPNYNADHRNHFHVDMTAGSMFIGEGVEGVDPVIGGLDD